MQKELYILTGPTAVGKTDLALEWASENNAEVLSCDAFLVYKGLDIGTAKPTADELKKVPHHGINLVSARQAYNVGEYLEMAHRAVEDIISRDRNVLITGGSGFYLKSFFAPVIDNIVISDSVHSEVKRIDEEEGLDGMLRRLTLINPDGVEGLDIKNPRRVIKALERCLASGKTVLELRKDFENQGTLFDGFTKKMCILMRDSDDFRDRIALRTKQMLKDGLVEEVKVLLDNGIMENRSAASAIGYAQTIAYLKEGGSLEDLESAIIQTTTTLVRKQRSWLKNQLPKGIELNLSNGKTPDLKTLFSF